MRQRLLVTGATGFLGSYLVRWLARNHAVTAVHRGGAACLPQGVAEVLIDKLDGNTSWGECLAEISCVIHLAARVHVMHETSENPLETFRRVNVEGTRRLAREAAAAGVRRFIFISSIKVNGEQTLPGRPFRADDQPAPEDAYGISKMEAEKALAEVARETGIEVVIIRPPLIYGPGVKGNLRNLLSAVSKGIPLPFGAISNKRSLVGLENLSALIACCIDHPHAAGQIFLVSDGDDLSTTELVEYIGEVLGKRPRLFSVPKGGIDFLSRLIGRGELRRRLYGSLQVDIEKTRRVLGWSPSISVRDGFRQAFGEACDLNVN